MEQAKISVIIPVYNVEPYLRKCLDSVVGQTYRNLEIILVDDGSPDNCGAICDEYAAKDGRVRVIHQANGGLAHARNVGLAAATGEWIGWVDPDDWVEPDMFEYLMSHAREAGADVAVCGINCWNWNKMFETRGMKEMQLLDIETALAWLLKEEKEDKLFFSLWDKLWRRELYQGLQFPEGRNFEDYATTPLLIERASRIVCLPECKYNYLSRPGSITHDTSLKNSYRHYLASLKLHEELSDRWPRLKTELEAGIALSAMRLWCVYCADSRAERQVYLPKLRKIAASMKTLWRNAEANAALGLAGRLVLRLTPYATWWSFALCRLIGLLYGIRHGESM